MTASAILQARRRAADCEDDEKRAAFCTGLAKQHH
jgi:hypothetical protein